MNALYRTENITPKNRVMKLLNYLVYCFFFSLSFTFTVQAQDSEILNIFAPSVDYDSNFNVRWTYPSNISCVSFGLFIYDVEAQDEESIYDPSYDCSIRSHTFTERDDGEYEIFVSLEYLENGVSKRTTAKVSTFVYDTMDVLQLDVPTVDHDGNFTVNWSYPTDIACTSFGLFIYDVDAEDEKSIYDPSEDCSIRSHTFAAESHGEHQIFMSLEYTENNITKRTTARANILVDDRTEVTLSSDFEQGFDNWTNYSSNLWLRRLGETPSSNTGPSTATSGDYYVYMETSNGYAFTNGDQAILTSPLFTINEGTLSFSYYMYGSDIGQLRLQILNASGWQTLWQATGQQHSNSTQPWRTARVSLQGYHDNSQIRFIGEARGGYRGDIAIDNLVYKSLPVLGFNENHQAFLNSIDGTSIALTTSNSPQIGDIKLVWDGNSYILDTIANTSGWQLSEIELILSDLNVDGVTDVLLKNLDALVSAVVGLDNQIVFADSTIIGEAIGITAVDDELESFFDDVYNWLLNENYFEENAPLINQQIPTTTGQGWHYFEKSFYGAKAAINRCYIEHDFCGSHFGILSSVLSSETCSSLALDGISCSQFGYHVLGYTETMTVVNIQTPDFSLFNQDALSLMSIFDGLFDGSTDIFDAEAIVEEVLEQVLGNVIGQVEAYTTNQPQDNFDSERRITLSITRVITALRQQNTNAVSAQVSVIPLLFLGGPRTLFTGHLSVQYIPNNDWISAFPTQGRLDTLVGTGGFLNGDRRNPSDSPNISRLLPRVPIGNFETPVIYQSAQSFWNAIISSFNNYQNNQLIYCLFPEDNDAIFGTCNGFNSNSFAVGVLNASGLTNFTTIDPLSGSPRTNIINKNKYPGSEKPVPTANF